MCQDDKPGFLYHFDNLEDPRMDRKKLYPLTEILFVVICASICGAQSWRDFVTFGEEKLEYLQRFLPFVNGIPSKNTFARVFSSLSPDEFKQCFIACRVAIDGYPPRAPTDPDVRTLAHPAPRYERFATLDKPNVLL